MRRDLTEKIENSIVNSSLIKKIAAPADSLLNRCFQATFLRPFKLLLNGGWMGHPLHPMLKDIPVGAWTLTIVFDLIGLVFKAPSLGPASAITTGLGIAGALGAAASGLMDWMDVDPPEKSVGAVHAILNVTATLIFALSLFMRWRSGWQLSWEIFGVSLVAFLLMSVAASLGGRLVYRMGVMINRNAYRSGPGEFRPAVAEQKLEEGKMLRVEVDGQPVLLVKSDGMVCAIGAVCSHYGAPLNEGTLEGSVVRCPWHGSRFALEDGGVKEGPAGAPVPCYEVRTANGQVEVKMKT
jgi:nitrite reductase/ring-hydroxylating ferredoxin subunit/uncharacterized membrane protein